MKNKTEDKTVYRVEGFSCANCAGNSKERQADSWSPGCESELRSFKIAVYGAATVEELEKAGAFENLKVAPENRNANRFPK
ncbi:hypothetical protein FK545_20920 (plasmid) [Planococcus glaciei]|nr:hypothetical protein [Planococcus glaciei]QDY47030.1 hypothetical protein FK545_20920 [Planococcus glaciei]